MSIIKGIQKKIGRFNLSRAQKRLKRKVKAFSIEKATSIGVLYNATNRTNAEAAKKFIQYLKEERKKVTSLGYIDTKDSSELVIPTLDYTFFDQSHLSKSLTPQGNDVEAFISMPFSILIDLNTESCFPIEYVSSMSNAKFKVGSKGSYRDKACDFIINIDDNPSINFLIIQVKHYLKMIKN